MTENRLVPAKRLYNIKESAEYLGQTDWGMRSLVWSKKLPVVRHGRKIWLDLKDLDAFIEANKK